MATVGGRYVVRVNGRTLRGRGTLTIEQHSIANEAVVSTDGSASRVVKPKTFKARLSFERGQTLTISESEYLADVQVTFREEDVGTLHTFTNAIMTGEHSLDTSTGEVSNVVIEAGRGQYQSSAA